MLQKTIDIEVPELVEKARNLLDSYVKQNSARCFVPYIDESLDEIRYLQFVKVNDSWAFVE